MNPTIDPNELKPAKEWLKYLPEPLRTEALEACEKEPYKPKMQGTFHQCIMDAFYWGEFEQEVYWDNIHNQIRNGEILPVQPEEVKEEKPETNNTRNQPLNNDDVYIPKEIHKMFIENQERLLSYIVENKQLGDKIEALQKELDDLKPTSKIDLKKLSERVSEILAKETKESFEKWLFEHREKSGKPVPAEPEPRKLPLTIEEVWEQENELKGRNSFYLVDAEIRPGIFSSSKYVDEFRHEKTAKKALAFLTLLKIAEAQNEIVPLGEFVWVVNYTNGEFRVDNWTIDVVDIEIYFHSEQGLKDCIAANEQLFKDYLEI